jgi:hypothetical protein
MLLWKSSDSLKKEEVMVIGTFTSCFTIDFTSRWKVLGKKVGLSPIATPKEIGKTAKDKQ